MNSHMIKYLSILLGLLLTNSVIGCSLPPRDLTIQDDWYVLQDYKQAELVFRGKVASTRRIFENVGEFQLEWQYSTISVYEDLKGKAPIELINKSMITYCMRGQELKSGTEYLFFVERNKDNSYSFTAPITQIKNAELQLSVIERIKSGSIDPETAVKRSFIKINYPPENS